MDHLIEVARHPDVLEAITLKPSDPAAKGTDLTTLDPAVMLRRVDFLATAHPNAWVVEVVHVFSADPSFAARVWVNLRYCRTFRRMLAGRLLAQDGSITAALKTLPAKEQNLLGTYLAAPGGRASATPRQAAMDLSSAVTALAADLETDWVAVDRFCAALGAHPEPPEFLMDLMTAGKVPTTEWDQRTQDLLADPVAVRRLAAATGAALPFAMVLEQELEQIRQTRADVRPRPGQLSPIGMPRIGRHPARQAMDANLVGLTFSGGGIRSATFNLGVLQALSKLGLLKHIDYLSTVSGGGYIGSWLAGWISRESSRQVVGSGAPPRSPAAAHPGAETINEIQRRLSPVRNPNPLDERVRPIRFLREYSNYLTPLTGFFSADTWTMIGIYLRNTLLNQVIIVSLMAAVLLAPRLWFAVAAMVADSTWPVGVALLLWIVGALFLSRNLRRLDPRSSETILQRETTMVPNADRQPPWFAQPLWIQVYVVLPWLIAAALVARPWGEWALWDGGPFGSGADPRTLLTIAPLGAHLVRGPLLVGGVLGFSVFAILLLGRSDRCWTSQQAGLKGGLGAAFSILLSAVVAGVVAAGIARVLLDLLLYRAAEGGEELTFHLVALITPGLLGAFSLAIIAMLGMLGRQFPDEHREWWSRLRTFVHVYATAWLVSFVVSAYVPWGFHVLLEQHFWWKSGTAAAAWIASTFFGVTKGQTAEDDRKQSLEKPQAGAGFSTMVSRYVTLVAPYIFIVGLIVGVSLAIDAIYWRNWDAYVFPYPVPYWHFAWDTTVGGRPWVWVSACVAVGLLFSWRVDINDFSIHHFYKNRLVRCYLGASRPKERKADWFTGFDPNDDLPLTQLDHAAAVDGIRRYPGPYPILNCALNLVAGQDLAWQERKATSFVFTPKFCGYDLDRAVMTKANRAMMTTADRDRAVKTEADRRQRSEAYAPTGSLAYAGQGPLLGTAMAISGAAASPNMGRATSPASAFLLTVFNVRLGWWLGNPRRDDTTLLDGPRFGLTYTALELFGGTDDSRKFVNLSDGGHFDNLGAYELIRRGCRYIIVCDAGQDGDFTCEDLGELVRKCRTDFGVEIDIALDRIRRRDASGLSQTHCVVGKIHYLNLPRRDAEGRLASENGGPLTVGDRPAHEEGYLVYIKPSMTGDEPQDVLEYNRRIPEFPHQSTADQWFGESQFESYRKLGMHIGEETFSRYQNDDEQSVANVGQLFERLYRYWYPPSLAINQESLIHAAEYSRIMEMVRTEPALRGLDHALFEGLAVPHQVVSPRNEFFVCNALIQLIENVYADLDLEHNWDHPHIEGWRRVFERWATQPSFRRTWKISEPSYAERFRNFYNDRLRGRQLPLPRGFIASHRGWIDAAVHGPGNTLAEFEAAIDAGATVIEFDVRRLASGELVIHHDETLAGKAVSSWQLADIENAKVPVLTLDKCLAADSLHGRTRLDLELKEPGYEKAVLDALHGAGWTVRDFVLTSFNPNIAKVVRAICPDVRVGLLVDDRGAYDTACNDFLKLDVDFLAPRESFLTNHDLEAARQAGVPLVPWPVNEADRLRMFLSAEAVAGVITDAVVLARQIKELA